VKAGAPPLVPAQKEKNHSHLKRGGKKGKGAHFGLNARMRRGKKGKKREKGNFTSSPAPMLTSPLLKKSPGRETGPLVRVPTLPKRNQRKKANSPWCDEKRPGPPAANARKAGKRRPRREEVLFPQTVFPPQGKKKEGEIPKIRVEKRSAHAFVRKGKHRLKHAKPPWLLSVPRVGGGGGLRRRPFVLLKKPERD